ncbi:MAG: hypothetical protein QXH80_04735 [Candidatus Nanoarchaeia archaeon]
MPRLNDIVNNPFGFVQATAYNRRPINESKDIKEEEILKNWNKFGPRGQALLRGSRANSITDTRKVEALEDFVMSAFKIVRDSKRNDKRPNRQ